MILGAVGEGTLVSGDNFNNAKPSRQQAGAITSYKVGYGVQDAPSGVTNTDGYLLCISWDDRGLRYSQIYHLGNASYNCVYTRSYIEGTWSDWSLSYNETLLNNSSKLGALASALGVQRTKLSYEGSLQLYYLCSIDNYYYSGNILLAVSNGLFLVIIEGSQIIGVNQIKMATQSVNFYTDSNGKLLYVKHVGNYNTSLIGGTVAEWSQTESSVDVSTLTELSITT